MDLAGSDGSWDGQREARRSVPGTCLPGPLSWGQAPGRGPTSPG
jgi:hypothetical protein